MEHLVRSAARRFGVFKDSQIVVRKGKPLQRAINIHKDVTGDASVKNFPCFANVLNVTFRMLYDALDPLFSGKTDVVNVQSLTNMMFQVELPKKRLCSPLSVKDIKDEDKKNATMFQNVNMKDDEEVINPSIHHQMRRTETCITVPHIEKYWSLISLASEFDRDPLGVGRYLVRTVLKIGDEEKLKREQFQEVFALVASVRAEFGAVAERVFDAKSFIRSLRHKMTLRLDQTTPDLIAAMSMSWALAVRIKVVDEHCGVENGVDMCKYVQNEGCHRFWESRFLFAGETQHEGRVFHGVALDTVLGKVWNASLKYKHCLCPRRGWECVLSNVKKGLWDKYVAVDNFSLSAFASDKRFTPSGGIHVTFRGTGGKFQSFKPVDSILLNPL